MRDDLIKRSDAIKAIQSLQTPMPIRKERQLSWAMKTQGYIDAEETIKTLPSTDVVEHKYGEWIVYERGWKDFDYYPPKCKCNQCGYEEELYILNAKPTNFCPNCGADMRGADDE